MNNHYLTYDAEQLATDPVFTDWARRGADDAAWQAWLAAHPERAAVVAEARRLAGVVRFQPSDTSAVDTDRLWSRIETTTQQPVQMTRRRLRPIYVALTAAASLALILFFVFSLPTTQSAVTAQAETMEQTLPDGSTVQLNAASELHWEKGEWPDERAVSLEGEAYFAVEEGGSFVVQTERGRVRVLGTTFNVYDRADGFRVHCTSGRVEVIAEASQSRLILEAGEACYLAPDGRLAPLADAGPEIDWLAGVYRFDDVPLEQVFAALERQFAVRIEADAAIRQLQYTGFFEKGDLQAALYAVCWPMGLEVDTQNNTIVIRKK